MRIGFTDQRLTAHGGLAVWTRFITERGLRAQLRAVLPHTPTSPNAYDPCDTALGFIGGILCGADKLARGAPLAHDPAVAEVLGIDMAAVGLIEGAAETLAPVRAANARTFGRGDVPRYDLAGANGGAAGAILRRGARRAP